MKNSIRKCASVAVLGLALVTSHVALAQVETTTTSTTSAGTIREFSPDTITVQTQESPAPVRYTFTKTTTYVDENGNPVSIETVKSGLPVTVTYVRDGDELVASKVIVRKSVTDTAPAPVIEQKKTTTTTTTSPNP